MIFLKKAFLISGVFISAFIGAGFSSGNEILFYFSKYGIGGVFGILLAVFLFSFLQVTVISQAHITKSFTIDKYLKSIMNEKLAKITAVISYFFMAIVFSAMLSGFGELIFNVFGIKQFYGILLMLFLCYITVLKGYKGFIKCESFMSVIIILTTIFTVFYILLFREKTVPASAFFDNWAISSVSYVSYNFLTSSALLCVLGREYQEKIVVKSGFLTFFILSFIMILLWYIIVLYAGMINLGSLPMLTIAMRQSKIIGYIYSVSIFISMFTTAISNYYLLSVKLCDHLPKQLSNLLIIAFGLFLSKFDFGFIIDKLYRFSGLISLFFIYYVFKFYICHKNKNI